MFKFIDRVDLKTLDNLFDAVLIIDKNRKIVFANKKARKILGEVREGVSCKGLFSICEHCPMELVEESEEGVQVYDVLTKKGNHVCLSMSPLFVEGEFVGVLEVFRDVSKVIHYMDEVKKQKEFVEVVLDSIVEAVLVLDEEGNVINHNGNASRILCARFESIKGKNLREIISLSLEDLPPEGERTDVYIETPCGKQKASALLSRLKQGKGWVLSLYIVPEIFSTGDNQVKIISKSPKFLKVLDKAKTVAELNVNVLITGETGTGKSLLAKYIHYLSPRRDKPFVKINCGAIPENLLEAELFGYNKGAFTGAVTSKPGKVEMAKGGTLFLDEIGELPLHLQVKLLGLIQDKEFERIGDLKPRKADVRIIVATNRNLKKLVEEGKFREDLYYRLKVVNIELPPLRERKEDIPHLVNYFLEKFSKTYGRKIKGISPEAMKLLLEYDYPGNVRELENAVEHAVVVSKGSVIREEDLPEEIRMGRKFKKSPEGNKEIEKIKEALERAGGNKSLAAKILGIHRTTLWRKLKEYGLA